MPPEIVASEEENSWRIGDGFVVREEKRSRGGEASWWEMETGRRWEAEHENDHGLKSAVSICSLARNGEVVEMRSRVDASGHGGAQQGDEDGAVEHRLSFEDNQAWEAQAMTKKKETKLNPLVYITVFFNRESNANTWCPLK